MISKFLSISTPRAKRSCAIAAQWVIAATLGVILLPITVLLAFLVLFTNDFPDLNDDT